MQAGKPSSCSLLFCCHYAQDCFILHEKVTSDGLGGSAWTEYPVCSSCIDRRGEKSIANLENAEWKKSVKCWISNWVLVPGCFIFQQLLPLFCSAKGNHCILLEPYRILEHLKLLQWKPVMKWYWEKTWQFLSGTKRCVDFPRWQGKLWYR